MSQRDILILEDEAGISQMVQDVVQLETGIEPVVICVKDQDTMRQAVEQARQMKPALIIIDLMEPGLRGLSIVAQLRALPETRRLHLMALCTMRESCQKALEAGCDECLMKPFDVDELMRLVNKYLRAS